MLAILLKIAEIDERIATVRENLLGLIEQAAAYSDAADEELTHNASPNRSQNLCASQSSAMSSQVVICAATFIASLVGVRRNKMSKSQKIKRNMEVIGADGVHVGTVERVESGRIRLTKADSGEGRHKGHHHFIDLVLVADVEGQKVRLSANGAVAVMMEEEEPGGQT